MYVAEGTVHIEATDQCAKCRHFSQGVACPLLEALCMGMVTLAQEMTVANCGFYKPFQRRLQVITPDTLVDGTEPLLESPAAVSNGNTNVVRKLF